MSDNPAVDSILLSNQNTQLEGKDVDVAIEFVTQSAKLHVYPSPEFLGGLM
jgi:hypothetical protein